REARIRGIAFDFQVTVQPALDRHGRYILPNETQVQRIDVDDCVRAALPSDAPFRLDVSTRSRNEKVIDRDARRRDDNRGGLLELDDLSFDPALQVVERDAGRITVSTHARLDADEVSLTMNFQLGQEVLRPSLYIDPK